MCDLKGLFITSPWISEQNRDGGYQNQKSPFRNSVGSLAGGARSFRNFPWPSLSMEVVAGMWEEQQVPCEAIFLLSLQRLVESRMVYQVPSSFWTSTQHCLMRQQKKMGLLSVVLP